MIEKTVLFLSDASIEIALNQSLDEKVHLSFLQLQMTELDKLKGISIDTILVSLIDMRSLEKGNLSMMELISSSKVLKEKPVVFICDTDLTDEMKTCQSLLTYYDSIQCPIDKSLLINKIRTLLTIEKNKHTINRLQNKINTLNTHLSKTDEKLKKTERNDYVTGLSNRLDFNEFLNLEIEKSKRYGRIFAVLFMDIDNFKSVNDVYGHLAGDKLLKKVAQVIKQCIRGTDFLVRGQASFNVSRFGGDEFAIVLSEIESVENAAVVANRILRALEEPIKLTDLIEVVIGMSIGIACYPFAGETINELFQGADMAMYEAKKQGKNTYSFYSEEHNIARQHHIMIEVNMREAIKKNLFHLLYQPIIDLKTGDVVAIETLCRCDLESLYGVDTRELIDITEKTGLIHHLGDWVFRQMIVELKEHVYKQYPEIKIHFNVSSKQLRDKSFFDKLLSLRDKEKFDLSRFVIELTEIAVHPDAKLLTECIKQISTLGIETSIDDFGKGGSSLMWLKYLDISSLKIDQEFVLDLLSDDNDAIITKSIIQLADNLELKAIAKGIETKEQLKFLTEHHCNIGQGYYFSRPLRIDSLIAYLRK